MQNKRNDKMVYKMYKKGRFWVFAGVTLAAVNFSTIASQAETSPSTEPEPTTNQPMASSKLEQKEVTLKAGTSDQITDQSNSKNESDATVVPTTKGTQPAPKVATPAADKQITSQPANPTPKPAEADVSRPETPASQPETIVQPSASAVVETSPAPPVEAASQQTPRSNLARADVTYPYSGTLQIDGGSEWTLDSDGVLTIHAGNVGSIAKASTLSWYNQRNLITKVIIDGPVVAGSDFSNVFSQRGTYGKKISSIEGLENIDTSQATNMSYLFTSTKIADFSGLSGWKTGNVTNMTAMFSDIAVATQIPVENWDVSRVVDFDNLFSGVGVQTLDLSQWQVGKNIAAGTKVSLGGMFRNCVNLISINVTGWDTSTTSQIANLFAGDSRLTALDIASWDLRNVTSASAFMSVFESTSSLKELTLGANTRLMAGVNLPNVPTQAGTWQNKAATGATDPAYTSAELVALYTGNSVPSAATTYIWSPASSAALTAKDVTVVAGPNSNWSAKDSVAKIVDADGNELDLNAVDVNGLVKVTSVNGDSNVTTIDASIPNKTYTVVLTYTDANGIEKQATSTVTVTQSQATLVGQPSTVKMGPNASWDVSQAVDQVKSTNAAGQPLTAAELATVTATGLDLTTAGEQTVTLSYTDKYGNVVTTTTTVTVVATQASLTTKPVTVVAGPNAKWSWTDSVTAAMDFDGQPVTDLSNLTVNVDREPDLTKVGDQTITLSYTDSEGNVQQFETVIHVVASKVTLEVQDTTVIAGPQATWSAADNFVSATDADGQSLSVTDVQVTGKVDATKTGDYQITYSYTGTDGNQVTKTVTVHVVASQAGIEVKDSQLKVGTDWTAADNLAGATDANGQALSFKDLVVTGRVNTNQAGTYQITYQYTDTAGNVVTATATITVSADSEEPGDNGNGTGDNNNGDGDLINEGNGGGTTNPGNNGGQSNGDGDMINDSSNQQPAKTLPEQVAADPATALQSAPTNVTVGNLPRTNEVKPTSWLAALGISLLAILGAAGYRRRH
ncbi:bacterial Ig-like domain-containing protein [Lactiplantibacillus daoliensis]|uniref:Bacterial Ig-like domain-containing protein n=1 Tax=Lactiplantibacillus daoliensis TaxID=2559916 RepID=A0ABW1UJ73_9LACO|nr:bacterial Ig-like domain-containing protein [Lactiplantibacillus daoliensis]